jgi:hypothetical protein
MQSSWDGIVANILKEGWFSKHDNIFNTKETLLKL